MKSINDTKEAILLQCRTYPKLEIRDLFKFLYQSAFGCEHLIASADAVTENIRKEYESLKDSIGAETEAKENDSLREALHEGDCSCESCMDKANETLQDKEMPTDEDLIEPLCGDYCRVKLSYLSHGLSPETLGRIFAASARTEPDGLRRLEEMLEAASELAKKGRLPFSEEELKRAAEQWKKEGYPAVHHSEEFREAYRPAYRVVAESYAKFMGLFAEIDRRLKRGDVRLAIEGGSASGKTTLSAMLAEIYDCSVFHMDDFFLRPEQRTKERYAEIGGNVDRERFLSEVLKPLSKGETIAYRRFDCKSLQLEPARNMIPKRLSVIEGAYSMHTELSDHYDLSVFLDISPELQKKRISKRNTPEMAERFFNEWIPYEHKYFDGMRVKERCDMVFEIA